MFPPGNDYPYFRPNGMIPSGPPPINTPRNTPMNMSRPFSPPPMQGRPYVMHHLHGGISAYPPPPPTPVPRPHPFQFIPSQQAFVPSLQFRPLPDTLPQPLATASPSPLFNDRKTDVDIFNPVPDATLASISPQVPSDPEILKNIEDMVEFVVRNGPRYERIARARHAGDPKFAFLFENDLDPEAVINREFYKRKKQNLQSQLQVEADKKLNKESNHKHDTRWSEKAGDIINKREESLGSPNVSDMDIEDDLMSPPLKRESSEYCTETNSAVGNNPQNEPRELRLLTQEKITDLSEFLEGQEEEHKKESQEKEYVLDMDKQEQCRLMGSFSGRLMGNYRSDTSDASDDSELSQNLDVDGMSNQEKVEGTNISRVNGRDRNVYLEAGNGVECVESRDLKRKDDSQARNFQEARPLKKRVCGQSTVQGSSSSSSGSRSRSNSRTFSKERRRSRSRSRSQPVEDSVSIKSDISLSSSDAATSNEINRCRSSSSSLTPPHRSPGGVRKGVKRNGPSICINHARGRCFRGDLCRFYHQNSPENRLSGSDTHKLAIRQMSTCSEAKYLNQAEVLETSEVLEMSIVPHHSERNMVCEASNNVEFSAEEIVERTKTIGTQFEKLEGDSKVKREGLNSAAIFPSMDESTTIISLPLVDMTVQTSGIRATDDGTSASTFHSRSSGTQLSQSLSSMELKSQKQDLGDSLVSQVVSSQLTPSESGSYFHQSTSFQPLEYPSILPSFSQSTHYLNTGKDDDEHNQKFSKRLGNQVQCQSHGLTTMERSYVSSFSNNISRGFTFSNAINHAPNDGYSKSCTQSQGDSASRSLPRSMKVFSEPATGPSSSYSYTLTMIPPLSSLIKLPGGNTKSSPSGDQYDPISDCFKHCRSNNSKSTLFSVSMTIHDGKTINGSENASPGQENPHPTKEIEAEDDPVCIVENASSPEDNNWNGSLGKAGGAKDEQTVGLSETKMSDGRCLKLLRSAVAEYVKEVLKPTWREGHMSKEAFKNIVKKAVDKVIVTLPSHHIPKSPEKVDQFMMTSRSKISKLVQGYIDKYQKA